MVAFGRKPFAKKDPAKKVLARFKEVNSTVEWVSLPSRFSKTKESWDSADLRREQLKKLFVRTHKESGINNLGRKLQRVSQWKLFGRVGNAAFYILPSGRKIVAKYVGYSDTRKDNSPEKQLEYFLKAKRAGVTLETPYAWMESMTGKRWVVTGYILGEALGSWVTKASVGQQVEVARKTGTIIGKLHRAGLIHGHPHSGNWIIQKTEHGLIPRLIDASLMGQKVWGLSKIQGYADIHSTYAHFMNVQDALKNSPKKVFMEAYEKELAKGTL